MNDRMKEIRSRIDARSYNYKGTEVAASLISSTFMKEQAQQALRDLAVFASTPNPTKEQRAAARRAREHASLIRKLGL